MNEKIHIFDGGKSVCFLTEEDIYAHVFYGDCPTKREINEYKDIMEYLSKFEAEGELRVDIGGLAQEKSLSAPRTNAVACIMAALNKNGVSDGLSVGTKLNALYHIGIYNKAAELRVRRSMNELYEMQKFKEAYEKWATELALEKCGNDEMLKNISDALPPHKHAAKWVKEKESFREAFGFLRNIAEECYDSELRERMCRYFNDIDSINDK